jgi:hypothetical protein
MRKAGYKDILPQLKKYSQEYQTRNPATFGKVKKK